MNNYIDSLKHPRELFLKYKFRERKLRTSSKMNSDKTFFVIRNKGEDGFFANFTFVLDNLIIATEKGYIPYVDMEYYKTLYNESEEVIGTFNAWEYYFEPVSNYSLKDIYMSKNVILSNMLYPHYKALYYNCDNNVIPTKEKIVELFEYVQEYIKVKKHIMEKVYEYEEDFLAFDKIIGIHVRGTDMYSEGGHHPKPNGKIKDINYIKNIME